MRKPSAKHNWLNEHNCKKYDTCNVEVVQSEQPDVFENDEILLSSSSTLRAVRVSLLWTKNKPNLAIFIRWRHLVCQEGALGLMGDWWLEASREEAIETLSYGEIGSVDVPWRRGYKEGTKNC